MHQVTCNGCDNTVPFNDMLTHDQQCETHAHREPSGTWGRCTHTGRCYRNADEAAA